MGGEPDPDRLAAAALACPDVVRVDAGTDVAITTYLPGRRVDGVRVRDADIAIGVVTRPGVTASQVGAQVLAAVRPLAAGRAVEVVVTDLDVTVPGLDRTDTAPTVVPGVDAPDASDLAEVDPPAVEGASSAPVRAPAPAPAPSPATAPAVAVPVAPTTVPAATTGWPATP